MGYQEQTRRKHTWLSYKFFHTKNLCCRRDDMGSIGLTWTWITSFCKPYKRYKWTWCNVIWNPNRQTLKKRIMWEQTLVHFCCMQSCKNLLCWGMEALAKTVWRLLHDEYIVKSFRRELTCFEELNIKST